MKKILSLLSLAALTIGLLGSCSKINERIDNLEKKVDGIENNQIATIGQQIATINQSIADLSTIRTNIQTLMDAKTAMGEDITKLKAAYQTLEGKINDLKTYVDEELTEYATKDWANATFATLKEQAEIITDVEKLKTDLAGLDTKLDQAIANLDSSLKGWVNEQLSGYYTIAQVDAKVDGIQSDIDALETDNETNKTKIEELETSLIQLTQDLATAKADIETAYKKAIKDAIEGNDGYINSTIKNAIDAANADITALTGRVETLESDVATLKNDVDALKAMIQTVSIIPAYSNGSLKAEDGILTINCVITPKKAVESLTKKNFTILTSESEVLTKSALYQKLTIASDADLVLDETNGAATIKVDVSSVLPEDEGKALTVAVNIKNGISDYTTEFVPVYVAPGPVLPAGALPGVFSVSATKKVYFSQGNLVATIDASGAPTAWKFSAHQYDCLGKGGANKTIGSAAGDVDLFGWSTSTNGGTSTTNNYGIKNSTTTSDYSGDFYDWGKAVGDGNTWRTLTTAEWTYLFNNHTKKWATVNGVNGYVIAPDGFEGDLANSYANDAELVTAGNLVFLPAAGYRDGSYVNDVGFSGFYWSSTAYDEFNAYSVYFGSGSVPPGSDGNRDYGFSVRLITEGGSPAPSVVPVTGVTLDKTELSLMVGKSETLKATVQPADATNKNVIWSSDNTSVATVGSTDGKVTAVAKGTATITAIVDGLYTATCTVTVYDLPAGALPGVFSVSATKKVYFSQGNLVATIDASGAPTAWKFSAHQYDCLGKGGANKTIGSAAGDVDLFGWSTSTNGGTSTTNNYGIKNSTTTSDYSGDFYDWGKAVGDGNTWRTLTKAEWTYLFNNHTKKWATVNGVNGYVIAPYGFEGDLANSYANDAELVTAGNLVFLPAAGYRRGSDVGNVGDFGNYWSSTAYDEYSAYNVSFSGSVVSPGSCGGRFRGCSVRLITESK